MQKIYRSILKTSTKIMHLIWDSNPKFVIRTYAVQKPDIPLTMDHLYGNCVYRK